MTKSLFERELQSLTFEESGWNRGAKKDKAPSQCSIIYYIETGFLII